MNQLPVSTAIRFDGASHMNARNEIPLETLTPHQNRYVAWSLDGTRILASHVEERELLRNMAEQGLASDEYVVSFLEPFEESVL